MDGDDFVFLEVIGADSDEIVSLCRFEFNVGDIGLELKPDSESICILLGVSLIKVPQFFLIGVYGLINDFLSDFLASLGIFPDHDFNWLTMTESYDVVFVPINWEDGFFILFGEHYAGSESVPDYEKTALVACCQVLSTWGDWNGSDWALVAVVCDVDCCWEGFESFWVRKLRDEGVWVDVEFFFLHSRTKIQVQTSLESFLNQPIVERNVSHLVERPWNEVEWSVFFVHFLPLFLFVFGQQKFFGWIIWLIVSRQFCFHRCNVDDTSFFEGTTCPSVVQLLFLLLFLQIVFIPFYSAAE